VNYDPAIKKRFSLKRVLTKNHKKTGDAPLKFEITDPEVKKKFADLLKPRFVIKPFKPINDPAASGGVFKNQ